MKLFGNKKRRPDARRTRSYAAERSERREEETEQDVLWEQPEVRPEPRRQVEKHDELHRQTEQPQPDVEEEDDAPTARRKAIFLLAASICVFICATAMCLALIAKSADGLELPPEAQLATTEPKALSYVVNSVQPSSAEVPSDAKAPVSLYDADHLNLLVIGWDETTKRTDTLLIASVHLKTGELALLSIPRDTYISGKYDTPKVSLVYGEAEDGKGRGIKATREMVKSMIGFEPDYYFVLDEATLEAVANFQLRVNELYDANLTVIDPSVDAFVDEMTLNLLLYQELNLNP